MQFTVMVTQVFISVHENTFLFCRFIHQKSGLSHTIVPLVQMISLLVQINETEHGTYTQQPYKSEPFHKIDVLSADEDNSRFPCGCQRHWITLSTCCATE